METFSLHSSVQLRISRPQLLLLRSDVRALVKVANTNILGRKLLWSLGIYPKEMPLACHHRLFVFWDRLNKVAEQSEQSRYRLELDVFEATLCASALRAAMRTRGKARDYFRPKARNVGQIKRRRSQLLQRIDNAGRQAKRRFEKECGKTEGTARFLHEFTRYRQALVCQLFQPIVPIKGPGILRSRFRQIVNILVPCAMEGLQQAGVQDPPEDEVRHLVRLYLRYIRRYRLDVRIGHLTRDPALARLRLAEFIKARWKKTKRPPIDEFDPAAWIESQQAW